MTVNPPSFRLTWARLAIALFLISGLGGVLLKSRGRDSSSDSAVLVNESPASTRTDVKGQKVRLVPSACEFDFGSLSKGSRHSVSFWLHNPETVEVILDRVETSCDCFQVKLAQRAIKPGQKVWAIAEVDFTNDPAFTGRLRLEATGLAEEESAPVFIICVNVDVP